MGATISKGKKNSSARRRTEVTVSLDSEGQSSSADTDSTMTRSSQSQTSDGQAACHRLFQKLKFQNADPTMMKGPLTKQRWLIVEGILIKNPDMMVSYTLSNEYCVI